MPDGGKGSKPRPFSVDHDTYSKNYDSVFNRRKKTDEEMQEEAWLKDEYYDLDYDDDRDR